ncbi:MAG: 50S ribosomal protein L35 [Bacilli bacterium]|nr:50S ribosomal protein L35 [Bacilli bacterium]
MAKGAKQKTHKASSKVFKVKKNGTLTYKKGNGNHKTAKDSSKQGRQRRLKGTLSKGMAHGLKAVIK